VDVTQFPGPFPYECFLFVNRITPRQKGIFQKIRLPEKIKLFRTIKSKSNSICIRLFIQNTIVLKPVLAEDGKPVASLASLIEQLPLVSPDGEALPIVRPEPQATAIPAGKPPRRSLPAEAYHHRKIKRRLQKPGARIQFR
jgi:hypothetical protein